MPAMMFSMHAQGITGIEGTADSGPRLPLVLSYSSSLPYFLHLRVAFFPRPQSARPGVAPVCAPDRSTAVPLTNTCSTPTEYWCGAS